MTTDSNTNAAEKPMSIRECLDAVHKAGGHAWDKVADPDGFIRWMRGSDDPKDVAAAEQAMQSMPAQSPAPTLACSGAGAEAIEKLPRYTVGYWSLKDDPQGNLLRRDQVLAALSPRPSGVREQQAEQGDGEKPATEAALTFNEFRRANVARCVKWHHAGINSWSASDWLTAVTGELGELASLLKMCNRERDGLPGNKFSPTRKMIADELADVLTYLDLLAASFGIDLGNAAVEKFNEVSERVGFSDRLRAVSLAALAQPPRQSEDAERKIGRCWCCAKKTVPVRVAPWQNTGMSARLCEECEEQLRPTPQPPRQSEDGRWISVKKRLPDADREDSVLIAFWSSINGVHEVCEASFDGEEFFVAGDRMDYERANLTHWMRKPQPPAPAAKGEEGGK
jgi:NTP pyrophosphatase (non-canonical NTP hydrolase)